MRHRTFLVLAALLMLCPLRADAATTVVYPTGDPAYDVAAVRAAVIARGTNPDGIYLWASDQTAGINRSTVRGNRVVLEGSDFGGISLIGAGSLNFFVGNRVEGSAAYAVGLVSDFYAPDGAATTNSFVGNQLASFTPRDSSAYGTGAHVFFDVNTRRNVFVGKSGTVKDLGLENVFIP